jgi:hypothetical protein
MPSHPEHPSDFVGGGEIALTPPVVAFAEQLVDLGGCESELPHGRLDVLRHQVEEADGEHGLEGASERTEAFGLKLWGARCLRQESKRQRCVQVVRDCRVESLKIGAAGAVEPVRRLLIGERIDASGAALGEALQLS